MATALKRDPVFVALTRPQMFAGVSYNYFIANAILATELFLVFKSVWVLGIALAVHVAGMVMCLREPRFLDLWITRISSCPRIKNHGLWRCNSYRP